MPSNTLFAALLPALLLTNPATATFTLDSPQPILPTTSAPASSSSSSSSHATAVDDQTTYPCGSPSTSYADRTHVTKWPLLSTEGVGGMAVRVDTAAAAAGGVGWQLNVAPVGAPDNFTNVGTYYTLEPGLQCWDGVGVGGEWWVGREAFLQVRMWLGNGVYEYQCAAIEFVESVEGEPSTC